MADVMMKRPFHAPSISQSHRDITEDRYRDLRRPRRVRFYCNGDRYFAGKKLYITPHRYLTFNDLLADLTNKLPPNVQLPYGVRQIYTPVSGHRIKDIEELQDGNAYVCAGFESFKTIKYGKGELEPWSHGRPHKHDNLGDLGGGDSPSGSSKHFYGFGAFQANRRPLRQTFPTRRQYGTFGSRTGATSYWGQHRAGDAMSNAKPKVITVVRNGPSPRNNVKILLNRRSVQSYEQTISDIAEAFGPKWKNDRVRKLFTVRGKEVQGISDFFRDDEIFIAVGQENLTKGDVLDILEELYPDSNYAKSLAREWDKSKKKRNSHRFQIKDDDDLVESNRDSGLGSDSSNQNERDEIIHAGKPQTKAKKQKKQLTPRDGDLMTRIERERLRAAEDEREKARKRLQKRLEAERRALDEERRKRGLVPAGPIQDPFKKIQEDQERERQEREAEIREQEAEEQARKEEERARKEEERARRRREKQKKQKAYEGPQVIVVVKGENETEGRQSEPRQSRNAAHADSDAEESRSKSRPQEPPSKDKKGKDSEGEALDNDLDTSRSKSTSPTRKPLSKQKEHDGYEADHSDDDHTKGKHARVKNSDPNPQNANEAKHREPADSKNKTDNKTDENANKPSDNAKPKDAEKKPRDHHRKSKSRIIHKSKLERQISNADHVLEKYEPGKTLGDGNFAIVKQCKLKNAPHEYAMKIVDKSKLKGKEHMIENEIAIMKQCTHPNIVKLHEEFETKNEIYLIMELVKGGDLFDAITQSVKFNEPDSAGMVRDLGNALFYLHSRQIVHRDLKPENLLVCRNKDNTISLKLADFGLAMDVKDLIYTVCGTPTYVAPEILSEIGYGLEVDMWAVGVICYILLCGFPPFRSPDRNQTELFEFIKAGEYEFLRPYWDNTSEAAKDLIKRLLVVDKKKRYTATDTLCHPWIITQAGTRAPAEGLDVFRKNLRKELEMQAKENLESYRNSRNT